jgi:hypothetical protein
MALTLVTGLPGSGKSRHLIELVNAAVGDGRQARTFVCSDYPWPSQHGAFWVHRRLVCGQPGLTCRIDHFVSREEATLILDSVSPGTLVAVEEAYAFGSAAVDDWAAASNRGVDLVIAAPSGEQMHLLAGAGYALVDLALTCQRCESREATETILVTEGEGTLSVCDSCFGQLAEDARKEIVQLLRGEHPFPGEEALYQPVELPELKGWRLARWDSIARADAMARVLGELGLVPGEAQETPSYLDVGCNTGSFCDYFARRGFRAKGVDATKRFITTARLLEAFYRRKSRPNEDWVRFELANAYEYLRDTQQERFDVTSAFAIFQWIMIQRSPEHGLECLAWL